jgi:hypothetical protein
MEGRSNVSARVDPEDASRGEQLDHLSPGRVEAGDTREVGDVVIVMMGKEVNDLARCGIEAGVPTPARSRRDARVRYAARDACNHTRDRGPSSP